MKNTSKFTTMSINLSKLDKEQLFIGKTGDKYLNIIVWENDTVDQYGNDRAIQQSAPKSVRESGWKGPYLGNFNSKGEKNVTSKAESTPVDSDLGW